MKCERPRCANDAPGDALYCSDKCFEADWHPLPVTPRIKGGRGLNPATERRLGVSVIRVY